MNLFSTVVVLILLASAAGQPSPVLEYDANDHYHEQEGQAGTAITGSYGWTSPEGYRFLVSYVADEDGYRIVESNAVPVNADGEYADGNLASFT